MSGYLRAAAIGFVALVALALAGCGARGDSGPELHVIKFSHVVAPATPKGQAAERFKRLAEERFAGRVRVEVYPSSQLMDDTDAIEALAFGEIQMIAATLSLFDRLTPKFQIFDLPFLFPDVAAVERFQATPEGRSLLGALENRGLTGLAFWHNGMKQLTGPRAFRTPADAAGLKFRIMESDVLQAQVRALGASPQKMAFSETYQALQTGAVDAQENTWSNTYASKLYEVQPFATETNHGYLGYFVAVNADHWRGLPADLRTGLEEVLREVTAWGNARAEAINQEDRQHVIDSGRTRVVELTEEELDGWRLAMRPIWDRFREEIGPDLIDAAERSAVPHEH